MTNTAIVKGMLEAFNRGDIRVALNGLTDDTEWVINGPSTIPFAGRTTGRDGVAGFFKKLALGNSTGRSQQLQKQVSTRFALIYTRSGGKVAKLEERQDTAAVASSYISDAKAARD